MRLLSVATGSILAVSVFACRQKPQVIDQSDLINSGVNIVPKAVLAASKSTPTTLPASVQDQPDLIQTISDSQMKHTKVIEILLAAGMMRPLELTGDYTVLAPTDEAFAKLPPGTYDKLMLPENRNKLIRFVQYHLIRGRISEGDLLETNGTVPSFGGLPLIIRGIDGKVVIDDSNVIKATTSASNGNILWIDSILDPDLARQIQ